MKPVPIPPHKTKHRALYEAVNEIISRLEPKTTSTDGEWVYVKAPIFHFPAQAISQSVPRSGDEPIEPWCCEMGQEEGCNCRCHGDKPHWESDYAKIWDKYYSTSYSGEAMRQDILELIRRVVK